MKFFYHLNNQWLRLHQKMIIIFFIICVVTLWWASQCWLMNDILPWCVNTADLPHTLSGQIWLVAVKLNVNLSTGQTEQKLITQPWSADSVSLWFCSSVWQLSVLDKTINLTLTVWLRKHEDFHIANFTWPTSITNIPLGSSKIAFQLSKPIHKHKHTFYSG